MPAFRPETSENTSDPGYAIPQQKLKRVALASFLCGVAACVIVALIAITIVFIYGLTQYMLGISFGRFFSISLLRGATYAVFMSALNWFVGYITIPIAWLVLGLSLGRFPRRGIYERQPYYRWGAIWGALLVGLTTGLFSLVLFPDNLYDDAVTGSKILIGLGAGITGGMIGALAGAICGWLFLAIVRPAEQVRSIQVDVF